MPPTAPGRSKSKMITFRLTADEYNRCREVCHNRGIDSVSGLARAAIGRFLREPEDFPAPNSGTGTLETRIAELESRMRLLSADLNRLGVRSEKPAEHASVSGCR